MRINAVAPLALAAIGILLIIAGSMKFENREEVFRVAGFRATVPTKKSYPALRYVGLALLGGGVILLVPTLKRH